MEAGTETDELYRTMVLELYRSPHHRVVLPDADLSYSASNPLCGDELTLQVRRDDDCVVDAAFQARACAIVQASADLMIDAVKGLTMAEIQSAADRFRTLVSDDAADADLGPLNAFAAVRKLPVRQKCALLPWESLETMLGSHPS